MRINAPILIGRVRVVPALAELLHRYPQIALDVTYSDNYVDLVKEGLDAVIRIGSLKDSTLVGREIGEQSLVVCGAPAYLEQHGTPRQPADIARHTCMLFRIPSTGQTRSWQLREMKKMYAFKPPPIVMNDGEALVAAAVAGMGANTNPGQYGSTGNSYWPTD